jgi:uncharacterized repeat protein (TIGR01451 family)
MLSLYRINKLLLKYLIFSLFILGGGESFAQTGTIQNTYVGNGSYMAVYNQQNFQPGFITTARTNPQGYIAFQEGSSHTGSADNANVNGYVSKIGNTAFTFPVGDGTSLRNLAISAPVSSSTQLGVAWFAGDPGTVQDPTDSAVHPTNNFTGLLTSVSNIGFWDWVPFSGSNVDGLTVTVSVPDVSSFSTAANLRLVGWNGTAWVDLSGVSNATGSTAGSLLSGTIPTSSTISAIGIGTYNPITDLNVTKTVDNLSPSVGSNVVFTLVASNGGPNDATNVSVQDLLPSGYTYVSSNAPVGTTYNNTTGLWNIGNLANGTTSTLTITATVNATGNYANTATISGTENDPTPTNSTSTVTPTPVATTDLSVSKTIDNTSPAVGSNVVFTLIRDNQKKPNNLLKN